MYKFFVGIAEDISLSGPQVNITDIHLILEYKTGEKWGKYKSKRANRYYSLMGSIHQKRF